MTEISEVLQSVLDENAYRTWPVSPPKDVLSALSFEDEGIMGFACIFPDVPTLLSSWYAAETTLLTRHALYLKEAGDKAWNVYSIFICALGATESELRQVRRIEENLERTRKIAACGLVGREDFVTALLPVLSLQHRPSLDVEDLTERLRVRLAAIAPASANVFLDSRVEPAEVARQLDASR
jgi:hypothetical protein